MIESFDRMHGLPDGFFDITPPTFAACFRTPP